MAERLRAFPGYVEPTEAEKRRWAQELDAYFAEFRERQRNGR
jgi:hypothetical protein